MCSTAMCGSGYHIGKCRYRTFALSQKVFLGSMALWNSGTEDFIDQSDFKSWWSILAFIYIWSPIFPVFNIITKLESSVVYLLQRINSRSPQIDGRVEFKEGFRDLSASPTNITHSSYFELPYFFCSFVFMG